MSISNALADARTLCCLLRGQTKHGDHAARLEGFYQHQAQHYDRFRERLLRGRAELLAQLPLRRGDQLIELGAGTGRNLEYLGERLTTLWRSWFAHDGVRLSHEHTVSLQQMFPQHQFQQHYSAVPYVPLLRVPYYLFLGRKP